MATIRTVRFITVREDPEVDRRPRPNIARIASQSYDLVKRECLAQGALWEDPSFPATDSSLPPFSERRSRYTAVWRRPGEICKNPQMVCDGATRFDIRQGELGDCWFLAGMASLVTNRNKELFRLVVPEDNSFDKDYAGVFHFKFWQYGKWVDVVIDDRLPTLSDGRGLIFLHSQTENEFWPALLEKAYAKLNGSYTALKSGNTAESLEDFTGGISLKVVLDKNTVRKDLYTLGKKSLERGSMMGCSVSEEKHPPGELNGLIAGHAYTITGAHQISFRGQSLKLLRLRNPWGNEAEWKGAWSDNSPEWLALSDAEKTNMGLNFKDDGEFWMSYDDFLDYFSDVEICLTVPLLKTLSEAPAEERWWEVTSHEGSWKPRVTAGGCINHRGTYWMNPQYNLHVVGPDEDDDDHTGSIIVALMQKDRRKKKTEEGLSLLSLGYSIYKVEGESTAPKDMNFFLYNLPVDKSGKFNEIREVVGRHKLAPGFYLIVPSTFQPNEKGDFLLRIFSEKKAPSSKVDEKTSFISTIEYKIKDDIPVYYGKDDPKPGEFKHYIQASAEEKRRKVVVISEDDRDEERQIQELFRETAGSDLEVDAYELRSILNRKFKPEFNIDGISLETARSIVASMDVDLSGKLGYEEFKQLWIDLRLWKKVFLEYDVSRTNSLSSFELRAALNSAGFLVSNQTLNCLVMRYSDPKGNVQFDDFLLCAVRLKKLIDTFKKDTKKDSLGRANFTLDQLIQTSMYS